MRTIRFLLAAVVLSLLVASCKKDHYDVSNVHGINAEGELLFPVASKSFTMYDMMERFQIDSLIHVSESGDMSFSYFYENYDVVNGDNLLRFKDVNYTEHFTFENPFVNEHPYYTDTVLSFGKTIIFESENVHVMEALMKSGRLDFTIASNVGNLRRVVLRSSDIKDAHGHDFVLDTPVQANSFGFDLDGLYYATDSVNSLTFGFEFYISLYQTNEPELFLDIAINGHDLAMHSMRGYVDTYSDRNSIDTVFDLFPDNLEGMLEVRDVVMRVSERNSFALGARLVIDTALVMGEGIAPYTLFDPMPLTVDLPPQMGFVEVMRQNLNGKLNAAGGRAYASTDFIFNPSGNTEMVMVADTCSVDVRVDVELPFSFVIEDVRYVDTVNMELSELEMPDMMEKMAIELTFTSTIPLSLNGSFYMYDSENGMVTDTLVADGQLIQASYDGHPTITTVSIDVTEERIDNVLRSDRIIMVYKLDTDAYNVILNARQKLDLFVKTKVQYKGNADFND